MVKGVEREESGEKGPSANVITYSEGNTKIQISVSMERNSVTTVVSGINRRPPIEEEASRLHQKAKLLMQDLANASHVSLNYLFLADTPKKRAWALSEGAEIFNWDLLSKAAHEPLRAIKTFNPEVKNNS